MFSFKSLVTFLVSAALTVGVTAASPEARLQVGKVVAKVEKLVDHTLERLDSLVINADASTSTQVQVAGGAKAGTAIQTKVESQVKASPATSASTNGGAATSSNNAAVAPNTSSSVEAQTQGTVTQGNTSTSLNTQSNVEAQTGGSLSVKKIIKKLSDPLGLSASLDLSADAEADTTSGK